MCVAARLLRPLISNDEGTAHPQMKALEHYFLRNPVNADAVISWIQRSPMECVVHDMANGNTPISLRAIAERHAASDTGYLAALLMEAGVVPTENSITFDSRYGKKSTYRACRIQPNRSLPKQYAVWIVNPRFADIAHLSTQDESLATGVPKPISSLSQNSSACSMTST